MFSKGKLHIVNCQALNLEVQHQPVSSRYVAGGWCYRCAAFVEYSRWTKNMRQKPDASFHQAQRRWCVLLDRGQLLHDYHTLRFAYSSCCSAQDSFIDR